MSSFHIGVAILLTAPFLISFVHGLRTGRAWINPRSQGGRRRFRWVDRHEEPIWFWGAMVAYVAAVGWILFFVLFQS